MVIDAQGNKHDRAGQFAGHVKDAPTGQLTATAGAELDEHAVAALDVYGLTEADVPGFADAWHARFGVLDDGIPESTQVVFTEILDLDLGAIDRIDVIACTDEAVVIRAVYEPERTGYDHPAYPDDDDDDEDREEKTHVFTDREQVSRLRAAIDSQDRRRELTLLASERAAYGRGLAPVWHVYADPDELAAATRACTAAKDELRRSSHRVDEQLEVNSFLTTALTAGTGLPEGSGARIARFIDDTSHTRWGGTPEPRDVHAHEVHRVGEEYGKALTAWTTVSAAHDAAVALPEGPLRSYLLDEREPVTVNAIEGTGRKARPVVRQFTPRSDLAKEFDTARQKFERSRDERFKLLERLSEHAVNANARAAKRDAAQAALVQAEAAYWSLGWPGDAKTTPAPVGSEFPKMEAAW